MVTITLDYPIINPHAKPAVVLAIHIVGHPVTKDKPIQRKDLVSIDKIIAEGSMEEQKLDLGYRIDTRRLLAALPVENVKVWSNKIK